MRNRIVTFVIAALLVGVAIGVLVAWAAGLTDGNRAEASEGCTWVDEEGTAVAIADGVRAEILEGYAWVNEEGTAIGLSPDGETPGPGYFIAGAMWREQAGWWNDTFPTCLEPLVEDQRVKLGVLHTRPPDDAPGRPVVVWLECLGPE